MLIARPLRAVSVMTMAMLGASLCGADYVPSYTKPEPSNCGDSYLQNCHNSRTDCPTCLTKLPYGTTKATACPFDIQIGPGIILNRAAMEARYQATDYGDGPEAAGCSSCGGGPSPVSTMPSLAIVRIHRPRSGALAGTFGRGIFCTYDTSLTLITDANGRKQINYNNVHGASGYEFLDVVSNDTALDGVYHDQYANISEARFFDATGATVISQASAVTGRITHHDGSKEFYDVIDLGTTVTTTRSARLTRLEDRNGNATVITYVFPRDATNAQLGSNRNRLKQVAKVTDAYGRVATFTYLATAIGGDFLCSGIALPNGGSLAYAYDSTTGALTQVTHPDGAVSAFSRGMDTARQQLIYHYDDASQQGAHRLVDIRYTLASYVTTTGTVIPQAEGLVRSIRNATTGEYLYFDQEDVSDVNPATGFSASGTQSDLFYAGGNRLYRYTSKGFDFAQKVEVATNYVFGQPLTGLTFETIATYTTNTGTAMLLSQTDNLGHAISYTLNQYQATIAKTTYPDATSTSSLFNGFAQPTHVVDRLGRVTDYTYDAKGNLLTKTVAVGTADQATWSWTYNSRGQALQARDALYDAAHPDLHVTDYGYDANGYLTSIVASADAAGGTRPIRQFAYNTAGLVAKSTDPDGRTVDYTYDLRNRVTKMSYGGNVGITADYETITYGTTGLAKNLVTQRRDRNGYLTTYAYDECGRVTTTTTASGTPEAVQKLCAYVYGTSLPSSCVDAGELTTYGYDYRLRRTSTTRQATTTTTLTTSTSYDTANRVAWQQDAYGRRTYYVYDIDDRVIRTIGETVPAGVPAGSTLSTLARSTVANPPYVITEATYDAAGEQLTATDGRGTRSTTAYDGQGRVVTQVQATVAVAPATALNYTTTTTYDLQGNRLLVTFPRTGQAGETGTFQTKYAYNGRNLVSAVTEANTRTEAATRSVVYTLTGKAKDETDFRGFVTHYDYYPCCDRVLKVTEPGGFVTSYAYDYMGHVTGVTDANGNVTSTAYDGRGRVTKVTNGAGEATTYAYDDNATDGTGLSATYAAKVAGLGLGANADGSIVEAKNALGEATATIRDGLGRTIRTVDGNGNANRVVFDVVTSGLAVTTVTDAGGHSTSTRADGAGRIREAYDADLRKTAVTYDANGNRLSVRDPNGVGQDCVYDAANRDTQCTDTAGAVTKRTYDAHGNVRTQTDALAKVTTNAYDGRDRKVSTVDRLPGTSAGTTSFAYDGMNNLTKITDAEGRVTTYAFDGRDLLTVASYPLGAATTASGVDKRTYVYDGGRRMTRQTHECGCISDYTYDKANRLLTRTVDGLSDVFTYDKAGRMLTATSAQYNTAISRSYTASGEKGGRLRSESQTACGYAYTVTYGYDVDDRITSITYPTGKIVKRDYTARHQLSGVHYDNGTVTTPNIASRAYDLGGRLTSTTLGNGLVETRSYNADNTVSTIVVPGVTNFSYTYDADKRKTFEGHQYAADVQNFGYDEEARVTSWSRDGQEAQNWTLTKVGDWSATNRTGTTPYTQTRVHSPVHETTSITQSGSSRNGTFALAYDERGNVNVDESGQSFSWDVENRMAYSGTASGFGIYAYDALGRRLAKTAQGIVTNYVHDGAQVIAEYQAPLLQSAAIGAPALAGSFSDNGQGTITESCGGTDIGGTSDQFRYASGRLTGDGTIRAFVTSQTNTNGSAKAGVMLRDSTAVDAPFVQLAITPSNGVQLSSRTTTAGAAVTNVTTTGIVTPVWLALERIGTTVSAYRSADGNTWTTVGSVTITFPTTPITAGLAVTSHNTASTSTATFTNLLIEGKVATSTTPTMARSYVYGSYVDEPLALVTPTARYFYHANHLYSVAALTDASKVVVERYRYDAYGRRTVLAADGTTTRTGSSYGNQVGFTGRYLDKETGIWYFRSRYYSSGIGRFIERDLQGYIDGSNLYSGYFVPNDLDPSGETVFTIEGTVYLADAGGGFRKRGAEPENFPIGTFGLTYEYECAWDGSHAVLLTMSGPFSTHAETSPEAPLSAMINPISTEYSAKGQAQAAGAPSGPCNTISLQYTIAITSKSKFAINLPVGDKIESILKKASSMTQGNAKLEAKIDFDNAGILGYKKIELSYLICCCCDRSKSPMIDSGVRLIKQEVTGGSSVNVGDKQYNFVVEAKAASVGDCWKNKAAQSPFGVQPPSGEELKDYLSGKQNQATSSK